MGPEHFLSGEQYIQAVTGHLAREVNGPFDMYGQDSVVQSGITPNPGQEKRFSFPASLVTLVVGSTVFYQ